MAYRYDRRVALRVSPENLEKWRSDLRRMTKIYKSVTAAPEDKQLELFNEARGLFNTFRNNFEEWVYDTLLPSRDSKKQSYSEQEVAKKTWIAVISLGGIFPDSWNYKTDKHEPAPYQLVHEIDRNITKYQRAFNIAFKAIDDLLLVRAGEGRTIDVAEPVEHLRVGPLTVVIHNQGRDEHDREEDLDDELRTLTDAVHRIERAGFPEAVRGLTVHVSFNAPGLRAGHYQADNDELYLFPLGMGRENNQTFIHESGHRFYYRAMPPNARAHWEEVIDSRAVIIDENDIKTVVDKYIRPFYERNNRVPDREELENLIQEDSVELEMKYRELADHIPGMDKGGGPTTPEGCLSFWSHGTVGTRVDLEHITEYGATNAKEAFAEAFMLWVVKGPGALKPWTRQFFETITRAGGAKFSARAAVRSAMRGLYLGKARGVR